PRRATLFPYTTLFRSRVAKETKGAVGGQPVRRRIVANETGPRCRRVSRERRAGDRLGCAGVGAGHEYALDPPRSERVRRPTFPPDRKSTRLNSSHSQI